MHDALPTLNHLKIRKIIEDDTCKWCHSGPEDTNHLFWSCSLARLSWDSLFSWFEIAKTNQVFTSLQAALLYFNNVIGTSCGGICLIAMLWTLWLTRNECIFADNRLPGAIIIHLLKTRAWEWSIAKNLSTLEFKSNWYISPVQAYKDHQLWAKTVS